MCSTTMGFGMLEECLRGEKARSFHGVLYPESTTVFWYKREEGLLETNMLSLNKEFGHVRLINGGRCSFESRTKKQP